MSRNVSNVGILFGILVLFLGSSVAEAKVPSKLLGKAFCSPSRIKDASPEALGRLFSGLKGKIEIKRSKDKHWKCTLVAFFRKLSSPGPITLLYYDKADKAAVRRKEVVDMKSVEAKETKVLVLDLDISPDRGFNKNRSYLIHVGQIFGKRTKIYARGQLNLVP
jgi:hypothetical protein